MFFRHDSVSSRRVRPEGTTVSGPLVGRAGLVSLRPAVSFTVLWRLYGDTAETGAVAFQGGSSKLALLAAPPQFCHVASKPLKKKRSRARHSMSGVSADQTACSYPPACEGLQNIPVNTRRIGESPNRL